MEIKEAPGKDPVKLCPETQQNCLKSLLMAPTRIRAAPKDKPKPSSFRTTYGRLFPKRSHSSPPDPEVSLAIKHIINLQHDQQVSWALSPPPTYWNQVSPNKPGHWVYLQTWKRGSPRDQPQPICTGPHLVLLAMHSSLEGVVPWIPNSGVERSSALRRQGAPSNRQQQTHLWATLWPETSVPGTRS